jgi:hypothetical protein
MLDRRPVGRNRRRPRPLPGGMPQADLVHTEESGMDEASEQKQDHGQKQRSLYRGLAPFSHLSRGLCG